MTNLESDRLVPGRAGNNGAWFFVDALIEDALAEASAGSPDAARAMPDASSASPATGLAKRHKAQQEALVEHGAGACRWRSSRKRRISRKFKSPEKQRDMMVQEIKVPTLGESVTEATIGEWLKQPGEPVDGDEPIASLETDKVAVEVPSPVAGVIGEPREGVGDTVEVGAVIATVEEGAGRGRGESSRPSPKPRRSQGPGRADAGTRRPPAKAADGDVKRRHPAVRRPCSTRGRPDSDQGHRQGRPADQGRRARRRAAKAEPRSGAPPRLPLPRPRSRLRPANAARSA